MPYKIIANNAKDAAGCRIAGRSEQEEEVIQAMINHKVLDTERGMTSTDAREILFKIALDDPKRLIEMHEAIESGALGTMSTHGSVFTGLSSPTGQPLLGKRKYPSGNIYEGGFVNGKRHGKGKLTCPNGNVYEGKFVEGKFREGKLTCPNGNVYEGKFANDECHEGELKLPNGDIYEGKFGNGECYKGKLRYPNGNVYEGKFVDGEPHGQGKLRYPNGDVYEGEFINGERCTGKGIYIFANGDVFREGEVQWFVINFTGVKAN